MQEMDGEDMAQVARIKLLKVKPAMRHVGRYVRTALNNSFRSSSAKIRQISVPLLSLDPDWDLPDPTSSSLLETLENPEEDLSQKISRDQSAHLAFACLNDEQRLVMTLHLGLGPRSERPVIDMRLLSKRSCVSAARLPRVIEASLARMRRELAN
jgi:hypothetical protein